jgi:putative ABC transport system permease protein
MEGIARNLKFAWRALVAKPSFSLTVVLTLALGIGANTAIFSILHALVLRSLPVTEPDRLVVVSRNQLSLPYPLFRHFQDHATTFDGAFLLVGRPSASPVCSFRAATSVCSASRPRSERRFSPRTM